LDLVTRRKHRDELAGKEKRVRRDGAKDERINHVIKALPSLFSIPPNPSVSRTKRKNWIAEADKANQFAVAGILNEEAESASVA
jgi:hypothetical protein